MHVDVLARAALDAVLDDVAQLRLDVFRGWPIFVMAARAMNARICNVIATVRMRWWRQCVTVMASLVGKRPELFAVEKNTGMGRVFTPPDKGFPPAGVLAQGALNQPGWTYADVGLARLHRIRADGHVLNMTHWEEQGPRAVSPRRVVLTWRFPLKIHANRPI